MLLGAKSGRQQLDSLDQSSGLPAGRCKLGLALNRLEPIGFETSITGSQFRLADRSSCAQCERGMIEISMALMVSAFDQSLDHEHAILKGMSAAAKVQAACGFGALRDTSAQSVAAHMHRELAAGNFSFSISVSVYALVTCYLLPGCCVKHPRCNVCTLHSQHS